jgi:hypothetical protein
VIKVPEYFNLYQNSKVNVEESKNFSEELDLKFEPGDIEMILQQSKCFEKNEERDEFEDETKKYLEANRGLIISCKNPISNKINVDQIDHKKISNFGIFNTDLIVMTILPKEEREFVKVYCKECNRL